MIDPAQWEIREFIERYVRSVSDLELLLLLESQENRRWDFLDVSREMRTNPTFAEIQMTEFLKNGFVQSVDDRRYIFTSDPKIRSLVVALRALYNQKRQSVIGLIYGDPIDRMRGFADAFRIKKDK